MNPNELKVKRAGFFSAAEKLINGAREAGKDLAGAELEQFNNHMAEIKSLDSLIAKCEEVGAMAGRLNADRASVPTVINNREVSEAVKHFTAFLRTGIMATTGLNVGVPAEGGYTVPTDLFSQLILKKTQANVMRQLARVIQTAHPTNFAVQNGRATAAWTAEEAAASTVKPTVSTASVSAYKATSLVLVSEEIIQDSLFDVVTYVINELGYAFGVLEEDAFINGGGSTLPTGILAAATAGITTASPTAITADEFIKSYHQLPIPYRNDASWLMHDSVVLAARLLKDTTNQYIWQPGLAAGVPDRLLGRPVFVSAKMPTIAATVRTVLFGDFSNYLICDRSQFHIQRLNERYAELGQVGFRGVERVDGKLINAEGMTALIQHA